MPTPANVATYRSICQQGCAICAQQLLQEIPPVPRHSRRRLDSSLKTPSSSLKTRSGEDHRTPIGSRSRWGHRDDVRDAFDGTLSAVRGAGNGSPAHCQESLRCWAGTPQQHHQTNRLYRRIPIGAAQRELSRCNGERFMASGRGCVRHSDGLRLYRDTVLPNGALFWCKGDDGLWLLGKISASMVSFLMARDRSSFLFLRRATRLRRVLYEVLGVCKYA